MGRKLCIGANHSVVLDFMKAGKCVSVSKTFTSMRFAYFPSAGLPLFMAAEMEPGEIGRCGSFPFTFGRCLLGLCKEGNIYSVPLSYQKFPNACPSRRKQML